MADGVPQTDVSRPSALPTAHLLQRGGAPPPLIEQNSVEYLDAIEEEWNKKVDMEVDILVDGMVDLVGIASVGRPVSFTTIHLTDRRLRSARKTNFVSHKNRFRQNLARNRW